MSTQMDRLIQILDQRGFGGAFYQEADGSAYTELEYFTLCGEDCIATIYGKTPREFIDNLDHYLSNFDAEEFERPWIMMSKEERSRRGAPATIPGLLESAGEFYNALWDAYRVLCDEYGVTISLSKKIRMVDNGGNPSHFRNYTKGGHVTNRYWDRKARSTPGFSKDKEKAAKIVVPRYLTDSQADKFNKFNRKHPGRIDRAGYDCPKGTRSNVEFISPEELRKIQLQNLAKGREIRKQNIAKKKSATVSASRKSNAKKNTSRKGTRR